MTDGRHFRDEETVRLWPPADPWAAHDGRTAQWPTVNPAPRPARTGRRPVFGRVYELFTDDPRDGEHPYVGQVRAPKTVAQRQREHKVEAARFPWKSRIIDGPRGRRLLETVYATGDDYYDQQILDQIEALWIDRLKTTHNRRDRRARPGDPLPARPRESARPARAVRSRPRRRVSWRVWLCLVLWALATAGCAVLLHLGDAPEQMIWALSPSFGAGAAWAMTMDIVRRGRKLKAWS
jgi:hypothetical protein